MRPDDYLITQGWMYGLGLTDKQRTAYAHIWGYSRDGRSVCRTTAKELAGWLGCSERHAKRIVNELETMGLIGHEVVAVSARRGCKAGVMTDFWAILPDLAEKPGKKGRIDWAGRAKVGTSMSRPGRDIHVPTPITASRYSNISSRCGCKKTRAIAREDNHHNNDFSLFSEENMSGLTPGSPAPPELPFPDDIFRENWEMLLRQPGWSDKSPDALALTLQDLGTYCDLSEAVYVVRLAVRKGWTDIKDPGAIAGKDADSIPHLTPERDALAQLERLDREGTLDKQERRRLKELREKYGRDAA